MRPALPRWWPASGLSSRPDTPTHEAHRPDGRLPDGFRDGGGWTAPGGRVIRHAPLAAPGAVVPLPVPMIEPAFLAALMSRVSGPALLPARVRAAVRPAVRLAPVAGSAEVEDRAAPATPARVPRYGVGHRRCPGVVGAW